MSVWDLIFLFREEEKKQKKKKKLTLCNENVLFAGLSFCDSSRKKKKESGVSWSPAPPSGLNGRIPASRHVLSHVFGRGHVLGQRGGQYEGNTERERWRERGFFLFPNGRHLCPNLGRMGETARTEHQNGGFGPGPEERRQN